MFARARARWYLLIWVAALGWLDVIVHRDAVTLLLILGSAALILFGSRLLAAIDSGGAARRRWSRLPTGVRAYLMAAPFLAYYLLRGEALGIGAAPLGVITSVLLIFVLSLTSKVVDERVISFYRVRDRVPRWVRVLLLHGAALLIGFGLVHGALDDLPALIGRSTLHPYDPALLPLKLAIAGLLSTSLGWFLFHRPQP